VRRNTAVVSTSPKHTVVWWHPGPHGEYTPGYVADHSRVKGHILFCVEGELHTELKDGRTFTLRPGMSYQVADNAEPHRSSTVAGAKLFIVD